VHGNKRATMSDFAIRGSDRSVLSFHGSFSSVFFITSHISGMNWRKGNSIFLRVVRTHLSKRKATIYIFTGVKTSSVICITKQNAHIQNVLLVIAYPGYLTTTFQFEPSENESDYGMILKRRVWSDR